MESTSKHQSPEEDLWSWWLWCNLAQWLEGTFITPKAKAKNRRGWTAIEVRLWLLQTLMEMQWDHAGEIISPGLGCREQYICPGGTSNSEEMRLRPKTQTWPEPPPSFPHAVSAPLPRGWHSHRNSCLLAFPHISYVQFFNASQTEKKKLKPALLGLGPALLPGRVFHLFSRLWNEVGGNMR